MKAAIVERYGPPQSIEIREVERPLPKDNEVLVRVHAAGVNSGDARMRAANVPRGYGLLIRLGLGITGPRQPILGMEFAGVVETVGKDVSRFKPGDRVFGGSGFALGCHAEYVAMPAAGTIAPMPEGLSFEQAACLCFGGNTAIGFFREGKLKAGERILINGASGAVGVSSVQIAKHFGAHVTAVCSGGNVEMVRVLGADEVIDYTKEDFTQRGETYDLVMDIAGTAPYARTRTLLRPGGRQLVVLGDLVENLQAKIIPLISDKGAVSGSPACTAEETELLGTLAAAGALKAVIEHSYPLERIAEAHALVDTGHKRGSVVVIMKTDG